MDTELFIENQKADINEGLASLLTLAIEDLNNFGSRQTTFSKSIVMPGTAKNNVLFGHIFELSNNNEYNSGAVNIGINFNPMISAGCLVFQDAIQTFKGTIRLLDITICKGRVEYEVALTGELYLLNVALTAGLLEDLDFSAYNHNYTATNIIASWDNTGGAGYYYPNIDYGLYSTNKHDWDIRTFRPSLYVKEYLDKMFAAAGFTYDCALFNTARFKGLIVPHNQKVLNSLEAYNLSVKIAGGDFHFTQADGTSKAIPFAGHVIEQDYTNNTDSTLFTYTGAGFSGTYKILIVGQWKKNSSIPFNIKVLKNGITIQLITFESYSSTSYVSMSVYKEGNISLTSGDTVQILVTQEAATSFDFQAINDTTYFKIASPGGTPVTTVPGDLVKINESAIPRNIKQIDFFTSIIKLFNLYVYEDRLNDKLVHISPYVDFYSTDSSNAIDWSYKVDRDELIRITPLSELNANTYLFTYKADSDYYNDLYNKRYNIVYGSYKLDTAFDGAQSTQTVDLIFAATPLVGYVGEDKIYSTIFKLTNNVEDRLDSVIRILQSKKITGVTSWSIKDGTTVLASVTNYGYAGHFNNPDTLDDDLNFGTLEEVFFTIAGADSLTTNQFNIYWSSYMAEITDKNSKLLTAKFKLSPIDILNLDFSKYIHVDGNLFRLYRITDYNLTIPDTCEIKLLKVINTLY